MISSSCRSWRTLPAHRQVVSASMSRSSLRHPFTGCG
jgi:hypothetical protein